MHERGIGEENDATPPHGWSSEDCVGPALHILVVQEREKLGSVLLRALGVPLPGKGGDVGVIATGDEMELLSVAPEIYRRQVVAHK